MTHFRLRVNKIRAYQCHCSLCRMQSGTASNLGTIITAARFEWLGGTEHIRRYVKPSGFTSEFCSHCGSPVPNQLRGQDYFWVPVGCLEAGASVEIVSHLCVASKAEWDSITSGPVQYEGVPELSALIRNITVPD